MRSDLDLRVHPVDPTTGYRIVTKASHPHLFEAFEAVSHDSGCGAGWDNYALPEQFTTDEQLTEAEAALAGLTADELSTFCTGEETDMNALAARSPELTRAHQLLDSFFEDFNEEFNAEAARAAQA